MVISPPHLALVAGATGGTGRELVKQARAAGLRLRGLTSHLDHVPAVEATGAEPVVGDLMTPEAARHAVEGVDAVLCAVGGDLLSLLPGRTIHDTGTINLIEAARDAGVRHFVLESAIGVGDSRRSASLPLRTVLAAVFAAKARAEKALRASGMTWTIVRPGILTDAQATHEVLVGEGGRAVSGTIPRADVAHVMLASLFTQRARNRTFEVVSRAGLRGKVGPGLVAIDWRLP